MKLFFDEPQFLNEKTAYDKVLEEPELMQFANPYSEVTINFDTTTYPLNRTDQPYRKALVLPFLVNPQWEDLGKLESPETVNMLVSCGHNVSTIKNSFIRNGIAPWELTFFKHSDSSDVKAIDFTYSEVVLNSNDETKESE